MNVEPSHIVRLYRNKFLIEILKYCLRRAGKHNMITKELLSEVYSVVKDIKTNKNYKILRDFYKSFFNEIILNFDFCM